MSLMWVNLTHETFEEPLNSHEKPIKVAMRGDGAPVVFHVGDLFIRAPLVGSPLLPFHNSPIDQKFNICLFVRKEQITIESFFQAICLLLAFSRVLHEPF